MIANDKGFIKIAGNELQIAKELIGLVYALRESGKKNFNPVTMAFLDFGIKKALNDDLTDILSSPILKEFDSDEEMMNWAKENLKRS